MIAIPPWLARRRSPLYRKFKDAEYGSVGGQPQVWSIPRSDATPALFDLSLMPRFGVRGRGSADYLRGLGLSLPEKINMTSADQDGRWVARLGTTEYWVLGATVDADYLDVMRGLRDPDAGCYPVPCDEGRAWFVVRHPAKSPMMAKVCGVDLRPAAFPLGSLAQTSIARMNAVVIHHTLFKQEVFSIFCDVAAADYLWGALEDALDEFGATVGGLVDLVQVEETEGNT